jgi:hypothetical protein
MFPKWTPGKYAERSGVTGIAYFIGKNKFYVKTLHWQFLNFVL